MWLNNAVFYTSDESGFRPGQPIRSATAEVRSGAKPEAANLLHELLLSADCRRSRAGYRSARVDPRGVVTMAPHSHAAMFSA